MFIIIVYKLILLCFTNITYVNMVPVEKPQLTNSSIRTERQLLQPLFNGFLYLLFSNLVLGGELQAGQLPFPIRQNTINGSVSFSITPPNQGAIVPQQTNQLNSYRPVLIINQPGNPYYSSSTQKPVLVTQQQSTIFNRLFFEDEEFKEYHHHTIYNNNKQFKSNLNRFSNNYRRFRRNTKSIKEKRSLNSEDKSDSDDTEVLVDHHDTTNEILEKQQLPTLPPTTMRPTTQRPTTQRPTTQRPTTIRPMTTTPKANTTTNITNQYGPPNGNDNINITYQTPGRPTYGPPSAYPSPGYYPSYYSGRFYPVVYKSNHFGYQYPIYNSPNYYTTKYHQYPSSYYKYDNFGSAFQNKFGYGTGYSSPFNF